MFGLFGCGGNIKYEKYSSKNPELNFTIDYISGWSHREQIGSYKSFVQVGFYEPITKDKKLLAMMVVTVEDSSKLGFSPKTLDGMLSDIIRKRMMFDSAKVLSKTAKQVCGERAIDIELSYKALDSFEGLNAKIVPMKERAVIFKKKDKFYTIRYVDLSGDFDKYSKAFGHIVKSIKFGS